MSGNVESSGRPASGGSMAVSKTSTLSFSIDSRVSRFTVRAFASGVFSAFGHNPTLAVREFSGDVQLDPDSLDGASMHLRINAAAMQVADNISEKDRREIESQMHNDVLQSSRYPEIIYECSRVSGSKLDEGNFAVALNGQLTLHGVTRNQPVPARVALNGDVLRAFGEFTLRQTDYELKLVSAIGGALKVKDEVKIAFDIVARKLE